MAVLRPRKARSSGLPAGCQDGVHRALTYELTASTLSSPLAVNSVGHRYVHLNASHKDSKRQGGSQGGSREGEGINAKAPPPSSPRPPSCLQVWSPACLSCVFPSQRLCQVLLWLLCDPG